MTEPTIQPADRISKDRRIRRRWSVTPALAARKPVPLIAVKLTGLDTIHIPPQMAIHLANALIDAVETGEATTYDYKRNSS